MTSPKTFQRYSRHWQDLFDAFMDDETKERVIECESNQAAKAMRLEFYKAREAFINTIGDSKEKTNKQYAHVLNTREVKIAPDPTTGTRVVFTHKNENWIGKLIAESLKAEAEKEHGPDTEQ